MLDMTFDDHEGRELLWSIQFQEAIPHYAAALKALSPNDPHHHVKSAIIHTRLALLSHLTGDYVARLAHANNAVRTDNLNTPYEDYFAALSFDLADTHDATRYRSRRRLEHLMAFLKDNPQLLTSLRSELAHAITCIDEPFADETASSALELHRKAMMFRSSGIQARLELIKLSHLFNPDQWQKTLRQYLTLHHEDPSHRGVIYNLANLSLTCLSKITQLRIPPANAGRLIGPLVDLSVAAHKHYFRDGRLDIQRLKTQAKATFLRELCAAEPGDRHNLHLRQAALSPLIDRVRATLHHEAADHLAEVAKWMDLEAEYGYGGPAIAIAAVPELTDAGETLLRCFDDGRTTAVWRASFREEDVPYLAGFRTPLADFRVDRALDRYELALDRLGANDNEDLVERALLHQKIAIAYTLAGDPDLASRSSSIARHLLDSYRLSGEPSPRLALAEAFERHIGQSNPCVDEIVTLAQGLADVDGRLEALHLVLVAAEANNAPPPKLPFKSIPLDGISPSDLVFLDAKRLYLEAQADRQFRVASAPALHAVLTDRTNLAALALLGETFWQRYLRDHHGFSPEAGHETAHIRDDYLIIAAVCFRDVLAQQVIGDIELKYANVLASHAHAWRTIRPTQALAISDSAERLLLRTARTQPDKSGGWHRLSLYYSYKSKFADSAFAPFQSRPSDRYDVTQPLDYILPLALAHSLPLPDHRPHKFVDATYPLQFDRGQYPLVDKILDLMGQTGNLASTLNLPT